MHFQEGRGGRTKGLKKSQGLRPRSQAWRKRCFSVADPQIPSPHWPMVRRQNIGPRLLPTRRLRNTPPTHRLQATRRERARPFVMECSGCSRYMSNGALVICRVARRSTAQSTAPLAEPAAALSGSLVAWPGYRSSFFEGQRLLHASPHMDSVLSSML